MQSQHCHKVIRPGTGHAVSGKKPPARKAKGAVVFLATAVLLIWGPAPIRALEDSAIGAPAAPSPSPSLPTIPPDARPPGERDPVIGVLAAGSIVLAAGAGIYVYRVIRKGL